MAPVEDVDYVLGCSSSMVVGCCCYQFWIRVVVFGRSILTVDFSCWVFGFGSQLLFFGLLYFVCLILLLGGCWF